jgi:WD40 repeat protein/tetratricopeptide (TPR) repeat protein
MSVVLCSSFSPDGTRIVTGGGVNATGEASVWDARTGTLLFELRGHRGKVNSVAFSPDSMRIVTGSEDGTVKVWNARMPTARLELRGDRGWVGSVAISPDGTRVVTGGTKSGKTGEVKLWDARTGLALLDLKGLRSAARCVAFSPDGQRIVAGGGEFGKPEGEAVLWEARTGGVLFELKGFKEGVKSVAFSPDGQRIVTGGARDIVKGGGELKVWDARTGTVVLDLSRPDGGPAGIPGETGVSIAFSDDSTRFFAGGLRLGPANHLMVVEMATGKGLIDFEHDIGGAVLSVAFSRDGARLVTGVSNRTAMVWNARTGAYQLELKGHTGDVNSVAFSPDGKQIVTGSSDGTAKVWDVQTGATLVELKGHTGPVTSVAFSAEGTRIVSAGSGDRSGPGEVFVWEARVGKEVADEEELAHRRALMEPNLGRYREAYLEARVDKDDFAAAFYLQLVPPADRKGLVEQADTQLFARMNDLVTTHLQTRKLDQAAAVLVDLLALQKARLGVEHADTLGTMNRLGVVYWQMRQFDRAIPVFEELVKSQEAKHGRDHLETTRALANLGVNLQDAGRLKEALPILDEAHRGAKKYPELRWVTDKLLDAYSRAGEKDKFASVLLGLVPEARQHLPKDSPQLAGYLAQVGLGLLQHNKWVEAEPLLRECLAIREKQQPDAWTTFNTQSLLGGSLLGQKKYAEAEPLLLKGYEGMKARETMIPPPGIVRIPEALDRLIELYTATNKPDEAKKRQKERAKYPEAKK